MCVYDSIIIIIIIIFTHIANVNETQKFTRTVLQVIMYIIVIYNMYLKAPRLVVNRRKSVTSEDGETVL